MIFLFFAVIAGGLLIFINPPFETPDEGSHFRRAYQISQLKILAEKKEGSIGGMLPKSIGPLESYFRTTSNNKNNIITLADIKDKTHISIDNQAEFNAFPNTALYSPIPYLPQAIGISIARLFTNSTLWIFYFGRIFNLLFYLAIVFFAIKTTPILKWIFVMLALMPMSIFLGASLSPDALTIALSFLLIAYVLKLSLDAKKIEKNNFAALLLLAIALTLCKTAYTLLPFIILIIPKDKFQTIKQSYLCKAIIIAGILLFGVGWYLIASKFYIPLKAGVNPTEQMALILSHPLFYGKFLIYYVIKWLSDFPSQSIIGVMGWLDTTLPLWVISSYKLVLLAVFLFEEKVLKLPSFSKIVSFLILSATTILITLTMYLTWSGVGSDIIEGLQGRYFIPLLTLLFISCYGDYTKTSKKLDLRILVPIYLVLIMYVMFKTLFYRYYL